MLGELSLLSPFYKSVEPLGEGAFGKVQRSALLDVVLILLFSQRKGLQVPLL